MEDWNVVQARPVCWKTTNILQCKWKNLGSVIVSNSCPAAETNKLEPPISLYSGYETFYLAGWLWTILNRLCCFVYSRRILIGGGGEEKDNCLWSSYAKSWRNSVDGGQRTATCWHLPPLSEPSMSAALVDGLQALHLAVIGQKNTHRVALGPRSSASNIPVRR